MTATTPNRSLVELPVADFAVPGMRCAGCISKLESGLALQPGIVNARVNFTAKRVSVTHLPETTMPQLLDAISGIGFEAVALAESGGDAVGRVSEPTSGRGCLQRQCCRGGAEQNRFCGD